MLFTGMLLLSSISFAGQVFQAGTITSLSDGVYDGSMTLGTLVKKGAYGLGTVQGAKGEMIIYKGKGYLSDINGNAVRLKPDTKTPFADVFNFDKPQLNKKLKGVTPTEINNLIQQKLSGENYFYIFKITGKFAHIKARTIPPVKEDATLGKWIAQNQKKHDLNDIKGTIIGIYSPSYLSSVAVPGFHFHFITKNLKKVYHVYDFKTDKVHFEAEKVQNFEFSLPESKAYQNKKISGLSAASLNKMEHSTEK